MREIKNNNFGQIQRVDLKTDKVDKSDPQFCAEINEAEERNIQDFSNPKAETLGRSQVSKSDNLEADVAFGMAHPNEIATADKFFDIAFKSLQAEGDADAYGKAAAMTEIFTRKEQLASK